MNEKNTDIFQVSSGTNMHTDNFFLMEETPELSGVRTDITEPARRLNDYDFNLLKEDAYKDVSDDLFKLEYKISKTEEELKEIDSQIQAAKDIHDFHLTEDLEERKRILKEDYEALLAMYKEKSLSAKITGSLSNFFGGKIKSKTNELNKYLSDAAESILTKLPKPFASVVELRKSLHKLENINKSVDELMTLNIPYGENINKYEQLSKYIIKANSIQNEISRFIK